MSLSEKELQLNEYIISGSEVIKEVIGQVMTCKEYPWFPEDTKIIFDKITEIYKTQFEHIGNGGFYIKIFKNYDEILKWLINNILPIPEIQKLNLSKNEKASGISVDDEGRPSFVFQGVAEDDDFIDLDALIRNICHDLIRDCIDINFSTFKNFLK